MNLSWWDFCECVCRVWSKSLLYLLFYVWFFDFILFFFLVTTYNYEKLRMFVWLCNFFYTSICAMDDGKHSMTLLSYYLGICFKKHTDYVLVSVWVSTFTIQLQNCVICRVMGEYAWINTWIVWKWRYSKFYRLTK